MRILIGGGKGFIGSHLTTALRERGHEAVMVSRKPKIGDLSWDEINADLVSEFDAIINLAGANIAANRWTPHFKTEILTSRLHSTSTITTAINRCEQPPKLFINASAIGYYPLDNEAEFTEESKPGTSFLAQVCREWEGAAELIDRDKTREAIVRIGLVFAKDGGIYPRISRLFKFGLGGRLGSGEQPVSWIHIDDLIALFLYILDSKKMEGVYNGVAPNPVTNSEFTHELAASLRKPAVFHTPAWLLRIVMDERADALLLRGSKVVPRRTQEAGFQWKYPTIREAFGQLAG